jgi:prephenate dehydratase
MRDLYVIAPVVGKQVDYAYLEKASILRCPPDAAGSVPTQVVYAGVPGAFSHKAGVQFFGPEVDLQNRASFRDVFEEVESGKAVLGIVPVENSLTGSIHENYDLLLEHDLKIVGEVTLRIKHHLIGHENTTLESIERVYSHPQVFQQCREYLSQHPTWDHVSCKDTASAVRRVQENNDPREVAIGSEEACELSQMKILKEGIETNPRNFTRFVVISRTELLSAPRNKTSLIYSVSDTPGALYETLKILAEKHINLVKLESRPIHSKPWEYLFYADLEVDLSREENAQVLEMLKEKAEFFKYLGSYAKGRTVEE